jgi:hypothetical protein
MNGGAGEAGSRGAMETVANGRVRSISQAAADPLQP